MESQVFATRNSVDVPLKSISISTPGVQEFMEKTMHIDQTEYLGKMEGYALQGVKGMASIYMVTPVITNVFLIW